MELQALCRGGRHSNETQGLQSVKKTISAREGLSVGTRDVTYENRIFNIRKKYTVSIPTQESLDHGKDNKTTPRPRPSDVFVKHMNNIIRNRHILRRGVWQVPFDIDVVTSGKETKGETKGSKRYQTQDNQQPSSNPSRKVSQNIKQKLRFSQNLREQKSKFPQVSKSNKFEHSLNRRQLLKTQGTQNDNPIQEKLTMNRRLAIQIINYELLGRYASSSFKI